MKQNHHSLAYKRQKQPNKTYKDFKAEAQNEDCRLDVSGNLLLL